MTQSSHSPLRLERLEGRDVPAVVIVNPLTATYTDVDGDHVTIKVSTGTLTASLFTTLATGKGDQLQEINFSGGGFDGASLKFSVAKVPGGDGLANVGYINSTGHDLGAVIVKGDLGQFDAGSGSATVPAVKSLAVNSLGRLGTDTQVAGGNLESDIIGALGALTVKHDVAGAFVNVVGVNGKIGPITIGGSLIGSSTAKSGEILSSGDMGAVKIGHDVQGGSGFLYSGFIVSGGKLADVSIGGSLIGGLGQVSGEILSIGDMGAVKIGHDMQGGEIECSGGRIASVTIGGSIIASSGALTNNATIRAKNDIGSLAVQGSLIGQGDTGSGASPVVISARGQEFPSPGIDLAIGHITVGGRVEFATILAGYDVNLSAVNGDAQIGAVKVGGDWIASNLVAGAKNTGAPANTNFGDGNDASIGAGSASIIATIASITIKGQVFGTPNSFSATDHFGFVAQQINAVKIGGNAIALKAGPNNDNLNVGETTDMTVHEV